jgi:hypothetical protein
MSKKRSVGSLLLLVPSAILLVIQFFGASAIDSRGHPIYDFPRELYWPLVYTVDILGVIAPVTGLLAMALVKREKASAAKRISLFLVCAFFLATSLIGCLWTISGHPTYLIGYYGREAR